MALCLFASAHAGPDPRFAVEVVSASGLGFGIYGDPLAALGKPTTWVRDTFNGGPDQRVAPSLGYGTWNTAPDGSPLVVTVQPEGHLVVRFDPPIQRDPLHWHGKDFIVFGNAFLACSAGLAWNTDLSLVTVAPGPDFLEPARVSVSPDGLQWFTYPLNAYSGADGYWPTQAHRWNPAARTWAGESDWQRPVPPTLRREDLNGRTLADAVGLLQGSAGGTAFSLADTPFGAVRFVRIDGGGGEVDAFARVSRRTALSTTVTQIQ